MLSEMNGNKPSVDPATSEGVSDGKNQDVNPEGNEDAKLIVLPADQEQFVSALEDTLGDAQFSGAIHELISDPEGGLNEETITRYAEQMDMDVDDFIAHSEAVIKSFHTKM